MVEVVVDHCKRMQLLEDQVVVDQVVLLLDHQQLRVEQEILHQLHQHKDMLVDWEKTMKEMVLVVAVVVVPVALVEMHHLQTMMVVQVVLVLDCHPPSMILE